MYHHVFCVTTDNAAHTVYNTPPHFDLDAPAERAPVTTINKGVSAPYKIGHIAQERSTLSVHA